MLDGVNPILVQQADRLAREFETAQPFRHVVIENFLDDSFCQALIREFPGFDEKQAISESGEVGGKAVFSNLAELGASYARLDRLMQSPEFLEFTGRVTGIPHLLYDPEYIGGGTHENLEGQELDTHVDFNYHPRTQTHRRLNLILFLNPEWEESWGGYLELLRDPWASDEGVKSVAPRANTCVIFETTESSWHGFRRIHLPSGKKTSRRSIAVYFYTKEPPARGAAPSHATFYYQRSLPQHIQAGRTLSDADLLEIQTLLARRDQQIQFLYHREMEFSETLANVMNSRSLRWGKRLAGWAEKIGLVRK